VAELIPSIFENFSCDKPRLFLICFAQTLIRNEEGVKAPLFLLFTPICQGLGLPRRQAGVSSMIDALENAWSECHDKERKYYIDGSIQVQVAKIGEVLNA